MRFKLNPKILAALVVGALLAPYAIMAGGRVLLGVRQGAAGATGPTGVVGPTTGALAVTGGLAIAGPSGVITFRDDTANALCLAEGANNYLCATSTNGAEKINVLASVKFSGNSAGIADPTLAFVEFAGGNGNLIRYTTCDGVSCVNRTQVPQNVAMALAFDENGTDTRFLKFVTTTGNQSVSLGVPLTAASGATFPGGVVTLNNQSGAQLNMSGSGINIINFTTCNGVDCFNYIRVPQSVAHGLVIDEGGTGTMLVDVVTTTGSQHVSVLNQYGANPATGYMGHNIRSCVTAPSGLTLSNNVARSIASVTLGAGNWEISAVGGLDGSLTGTDFKVGISATSGSFTGTQLGLTQVESPTVSSATADVTLTIPGVQFLPTGSTNYFLTLQTTIAAGTALGYGCISAWNR